MIMPRIEARIITSDMIVLPDIALDMVCHLTAVAYTPAISCTELLLATGM